MVALYKMLDFKLLKPRLQNGSFDCTGDVMFADVKSENGRPAGYGTVRFKNADDAPKAIGILCCIVSHTFVQKYFFTILFSRLD